MNVPFPLLWLFRSHFYQRLKVFRGLFSDWIYPQACKESKRSSSRVQSFNLWFSASSILRGMRSWQIKTIYYRGQIISLRINIITKISLTILSTSQKLTMWFFFLKIFVYFTIYLIFALTLSALVLCSYL
jgi:hypothetical protein